MLAHLEGIELADVKITWKRNVVKLKGEIVYKKNKEGEHVYSGGAIEVREAVEANVKQWLEDRGGADSD